ncbi:MAG: restriction endonuclease subunit S [Chloroflexota bacterium]|nr:restriction endonuclease subunit S [Chloroflexota bacterium]
MQPRDILFSHINSLKHVGKVAFYERDKILYHGMNLLLIRPDDSIVKLSYLFQILSSEKGRANARHEAKPAINQVSLAQKQVLSLPLLLPPLPEQRRIAEILDAHDVCIHTEDGVLGKRRHVKRGLMDDLLTGKVRTSLS